jgi:hypothetical protein
MHGGRRALAQGHYVEEAEDPLAGGDVVVSLARICRAVLTGMPSGARGIPRETFDALSKTEFRVIILRTEAQGWGT